MKNKYRVVVLATDEVLGTYDKLDAALNQKVISEHLLDTECCVMDETAAFEMYEEGLLTMEQYEDLLRFNEED